MSAGTEQRHFPKGHRLGPYEIASSIGAGGMGEVFRARDTRLNREVAIKVLPKDFASDVDRLRRFEQEAKTLAALNHPNVLTIHDAGVHEGAPYLVSELLRGQTLREVLGGTNATALPVRKATDYALQIAQGLAAAHGKGVIHRDLKPENIFVTQDGRVKILDFGLAKLKQVGRVAPRAPADVAEATDGLRGATSPTIRIDADAIVNTTEPGMVLGTPAYMAPEQVRGEPADHRADIFAFGSSSSGHVVFVDMSGEVGQRLFAMPVSLNTLERTGDPFRLTESGPRPSVSADGTLAIVHTPTLGAQFAPRQLIWVDRSGKPGTPFGPVQKGLSVPRLSPDERSVAYQAGQSFGTMQTWIVDLAGGGSFPLRPEGESEELPAWLPSGREIAVTSLGTNDITAIIRPVEGAGANKTIGAGRLIHLSRTGQYAFLRRGGSGRSITNFYVRLTSEPFEPILLPGGPLNLVNRLRLRPHLSPDNTILAFESDDSGRDEVWAVAFPSFTNRVMVSRGGGVSPQWSRDGKELFYLSEDARTMMMAPVVDQNGRQFGAPVKLFDLPATIYPGDNLRRLGPFDVSADGQRFLMMYNVPDANPSTPELGATVLLIENWFEEYREKK